MTDLRNAAGRGGLGAVMGSKNLKCIAVKGATVPQAAEPEKFRDLARWMNMNYMNHGNGASFHEFGTGADMTGFNAIGNLPVRNWNDRQFEDVAMITARTLRDTYRVAMEGCPGCQIRCKKVVALENDSFKVDPRNGGPEYETLASFGSFMGINDLAAICRANELCSLHSLDTISLGGTIAFAMECFEKGILTREDTGGIELRFGNADAMLQVIELIAHRQGIGDILADGSRKAARRIGRGAEAFAMQVKGVEFGMHDPRVKQGLGLIYAIAASGADHMAGAHDTSFTQEGRAMEGVRSLDSPTPLPANDLSTAKVDRVKSQHCAKNFGDSLVMCHFVPWTLRQQVDLLRALTGWDYTDFEALRQGERVATMARVFNLREGLTAADDQLPERFFSPAPPGALKGNGDRSRRIQSREANVLHPHGLGPGDGGADAGEAGGTGRRVGRILEPSGTPLQLVDHRIDAVLDRQGLEPPGQCFLFTGLVDFGLQLAHFVSEAARQANGDAQGLRQRRLVFAHVAFQRQA